MLVEVGDEVLLRLELPLELLGAHETEGSLLVVVGVALHLLIRWRI